MTEPAVDADPLIGELVGGRYEIVRQIGRGGMGAIYEVRNTRLGRPFALKTLTRAAAANREIVSRFRREADVIARIHHPNIVEIVDWEHLADGSPAIVMEYLHGEDLATRIEAGPMAWSVLARLADEILAALSAAHANGVVHRDLKPQNVYLARDDSGGERVKLLDFGVSKVREASSFVTSGDRLLGTPAYMAPEQAEGGGIRIGPQTDVWAMGALLYELATGRTAFAGQSVPSTLYKVCHRPPPRMLEARPDAPAAFVDVVSDALRKDISERIADAARLRRRLREALADMPGVRYADALPAEDYERASGVDGDASIMASRDASLQQSRARRRSWIPAAIVTVTLAAVSVAVAVVMATRTHVPTAPSTLAAPPFVVPAREAINMPAVAPARVEPPPLAPALVAPTRTTEASPGQSTAKRARQPRSSPPPTLEMHTVTEIQTQTVVPGSAARRPCAKNDVECLYGDGT
jgi:serine/threonine-protein kinase